MQNVLSHLRDVEASKAESNSQENIDGGFLKNVELSHEEMYLAVMKPLQFGKSRVLLGQYHTQSPHFCQAADICVTNSFGIKRICDAFPSKDM